MPSGANEANEPAEPALLLLQQRLQELGLHRPPAKEEQEEDCEELREDEEDEDEADTAALLLPAPLLPAVGAGEGEAGARGVMAAMLSHTFGEAPGGEQAALLRGRSVNTTECVPVPSSEHVAEIVGRQGECGEPRGHGRESRGGRLGCTPEGRVCSGDPDVTP